MTHDILLMPTNHDESTKPVRIPGELWTRILRAAEAHGALILERYSAAQAGQLAAAVRAALEPPVAVEAPRRFAVFQQPRPDPGLPLRHPEVQEDVQAVLAVFERGCGVLTQRATPTALRALPDRGVPGAGQAGTKLPLARPTPAG
jgi:hypothetical protein